MVLSSKNVSDVAMLNSLLIVVMSAKHASSVVVHNRLVVLNSLLFLVMPTAKASNVSSPAQGAAGARADHLGRLLGRGPLLLHHARVGTGP